MSQNHLLRAILTIRCMGPFTRKSQPNRMKLNIYIHQYYIYMHEYLQENTLKFAVKMSETPRFRLFRDFLSPGCNCTLEETEESMNSKERRND